jgi:hypothetical protein
VWGRDLIAYRCLWLVHSVYSNTPKNLRHSCQLTRSWQVSFWIRIDFVARGVTTRSITVTCFVAMFTKRFGREDLGNCLRRSSYYMTTLVHMRQIWRRRHWQHWGVKSWTILLTVLLSFQWFSFVRTHQSAPMRMMNSNAVGINPFLLLASLTCQDDVKKCVCSRDEYLEKEGLAIVTCIFFM